MGIIKTSELKNKEVIDVNSGKRLGIISDIDIDLVEGRIKGISVPKEEKGFKIFGAKEDVYIAWDEISRIGHDVILVDASRINNHMINED
ncbi:YlmC/YmxH family sporulation protein [Orenia metallireducens]|jgi:YlmC/YmxH family sporulation protein|uniref:Sporulation protein, YlmC/YmxH family n=1 Tax=Orenia metallireducens TaxID=1413210 RepID=A0A285GVU4_9FIRM|nr:YlmC/YmxH family sporulation protein [Orenia metallireducens]PRX31094.1 YlmC/YmxH family sporulation protein [Orenia metallireducens]SNY27632.1 sporulation protein, YlmC/YmxH family [Orenia metallireducens]